MSSSRLSELPFADVRRFVAKALLADDAPENRRFRIDPATLAPAAVYRFCESTDEATRALGMELINRLPRLRVPEELFRLTESPDRKVRAFVIRALWSLYRDRGADARLEAAGAAEAARSARRRRRPPRSRRRPAATACRTGRSSGRPASRRSREFLRRMLFEIPPGRPRSRAKAVDDAEPRRTGRQRRSRRTKVVERRSRCRPGGRSSTWSR